MVSVSCRPAHLSRTVYLTCHGASGLQSARVTFVTRLDLGMMFLA